MTASQFESQRPTSPSVESQPPSSGIPDGRPLILDVPSVCITQVLPLDHLIRTIEDHWQAPVAGVNYPVLWVNGLTTARDPIFKSHATRPGQCLEDVATFCSDRSLKLCLDFNLDLDALNLDFVRLKDLYGNVSAQACINTPAVAVALRAIANEIAASLGRNDGHDPSPRIVLSLHDLWPMSADGIVRPNCFCRHCRESLEDLDPGLLEHFKTVPNPYDLVLRDSGGGIAHIHSFTSQTTPADLESLIQASHFPSYLTTSGRIQETELDSVLETWTGYIHRMVHARHALTVTAVNSVIAILREAWPASEVSVIVGDAPFDWTAGLFLDQLGQDIKADEFWVHPSNSYVQVEAERIRFYAMDSAGYYFRGFLEAVEAGLSSTREVTPGREQGHLYANAAGRARNALARQSTPFTLTILPREPHHIMEDVVVPAFLGDIAEKLIKAFTPKPEQADIETFIRKNLSELLSDADQS